MPTISPRSDRGGKYLLRYQDIDGKYYRIDTGTTDEKVARVWLAEAEKRLSLARIGQIEKVGPLTIHDILGTSKPEKEEKLSTFKTVYIDRCEHELEFSASTLELIGNAFDSFINTVGDRKLGAVTPDQVMKWKRTVKISKTSVSIYQRMLHAAYNRAIAWEFTLKNPFAGIKLPRIESVRHPMAFEDVRVLLDSLDDDWFLTYIRFLLYTGKRRNEILFLKNPDDIDTVNWILHVTEAKTRSRTEIPINQALQETIDWQNLPKGYVFESEKIPGQPWNQHWVTHRFKCEMKRAGLPDHYSLHSLRHTYATHLRMQGVPRDIIQALLGHTTPETTSGYDHTRALYFRQFADMVNFEEE